MIKERTRVQFIGIDPHKTPEGEEYLSQLKGYIGQTGLVDMVDEETLLHVVEFDDGQCFALYSTEIKEVD